VFFGRRLPSWISNIRLDDQRACAAHKVSLRKERW
jgi:hypothetical protein